MSFAAHYFANNKYFNPRIQEPPSGLLSFIVVIPAYLEENIIKTLESLQAAKLPAGPAEVIIVHNFPESDNDQNKAVCKDQFRSVSDWSVRNSTAALRFFPLLAGEMSPQHAGAGLARKTGMDEALYRFGMIDNPEGMILSLDADTLVCSNYFSAIERALERNPSCGGCLVPFSHPLEGDDFQPDIYRAITQYELHLRYYKHMVQYTGFPHAHYTIGSCFGAKAGVYARHGGMNQRKAGEDFYFLNKLFPHAHFPVATGTLVFPSPRPSSRVVFGTGPVIRKLITNPEHELLTYHPEAFIELKKLFDLLPSLFPYGFNKAGTACKSFNPGLQEFLSEQRFDERLEEIAANTASCESFIKRFYLWFDGFRVVKYLNFIHRKYLLKIPVSEAVMELFHIIGEDVTDKTNTTLLKILRGKDRISDDC